MSFYMANYHYMPTLPYLVDCIWAVEKYSGSRLHALLVGGTRLSRDLVDLLALSRSFESRSDTRRLVLTHGC